MHRMGEAGQPIRGCAVTECYKSMRIFDTMRKAAQDRHYGAMDKKSCRTFFESFHRFDARHFSKYTPFLARIHG